MSYFWNIPFLFCLDDGQQGGINAKWFAHITFPNRHIWFIIISSLIWKYPKVEGGWTPLTLLLFGNITAAFQKLPMVSNFHLQPPHSFRHLLKNILISIFTAFQDFHCIHNSQNFKCCPSFSSQKCDSFKHHLQFVHCQTASTATCGKSLQHFCCQKGLDVCIRLEDPTSLKAYSIYDLI